MKLKLQNFFVLASISILLILFIYNKFKPTCPILNKQIDLDKQQSIQSLIDTGFHGDAKTELIDAIKKSNLELNKPKVKISEDWCYLADSNFDPSLGLLEKKITRLEVPLIKWEFPSIGQFKLWLLCAGTVITVYALLKWITENLGHKKLYVEIKDFNDEATTFKIGKGTPAIIKDLLIKSNVLGSNPELTIAVEPIGKFESTIEINQLAQWLKLVNWLFSPSQSFTLSGYCQQSKKGVGLVLILKKSSGEVFTKTLWQKDYDPSLKMSKDVTDLHKLLAIPAATWILSELNNTALKEWLKFGNSNEYESYTYSRIGSYWYRKGDFTQSQEMLCKSLAYNEDNRFALLTLGVIRIEQAVEREDRKLLDEAKELLKKTKRISGSRGKGESPDNNDNPPDSPVWYKAMFQLLVIEQYEKCMFQDPKDPSRAETLGTELFRAVESFHQKHTLPETLGKILGKELFHAVKSFYQKHTLSETQEKLKEFLDEFEIPARIIYASTLVNLKKDYLSNKQIDKIKSADRKLLSFDNSGDLSSALGNDCKKPILDPLVYYNYACYYALRVKSDEDSGEKSQEDMFRYLKYALKQDNSLARWAAKDPSFNCLEKNPKLASSFHRIIYLANQNEL